MYVSLPSSSSLQVYVCLRPLNSVSLKRKFVMGFRIREKSRGGPATNQVSCDGNPVMSVGAMII